MVYHWTPNSSEYPFRYFLVVSWLHGWVFKVTQFLQTDINKQFSFQFGLTQNTEQDKTKALDIWRSYFGILFLKIDLRKKEKKHALKMFYFSYV